MAQKSFLSALELLSSGTQKDRSNVLADLKHILTTSRGTSNLNGVAEKKFSLLFEAVFRFIAVEKVSYLKAKSTSGASSRLGLAASVLRLAVQISLRRLRSKSVEAVLNHIIKTLPAGGGRLCEPLSVDFLKCLALIVGYQPLVEHLPNKKWHAVVEFCIDSIEAVGSMAVDIGTRATESSMTRSDRSTNRSSRTSTQEMVTRTRPTEGSHQLQTELILCLRQLTRAPSCPIMEKADAIVATIVAFLQSSPSVGGAHQEAFATINSVTATACLESAALMDRIVSDFLPLIRSFWNPKHTATCDEMLILLLQCRAHIKAVVTRPGSAETSENLEMLVNVLFNEYSHRPERSQLQIESLRFQTVNCAPWDDVLLSMGNIGCRHDDPRAESHWMLVYLVASFTTDLDRVDALNEPENRSEDGLPLKKRRKTRRLLDYLHKSMHPQPFIKVAALQVLSFMLSLGPPSSEELESLMEKLNQVMSEEKPSVANWATLVLSNCAKHPSASNMRHHSDWVSSWQISARLMVDTTACRASCYHMTVLLETGLVSYESVSETVSSVMSSIELRGPALVGDSVATFWMHLIRLVASESPASFAITVEKVLRWFFSRWIPSKIDDRYYVLQNARTSNAMDVMLLLSTCMDVKIPFRSMMSITVAGPIAQMWLQIKQNHQLRDYLFYQALPEFQHPDHPASKSRVITEPFSANRPNEGASTIIEHCIRQLHATSEKIGQWIADTPQNITGDVVRIVLSSCAVAAGVCHLANTSYSPRNAQLSTLIADLSKRMTGFISRPECEQALVDAALEIIVDSSPRIQSTQTLDDDFFAAMLAFPFVTHISDALEERRNLRDSHGLENGNNAMDIDSEFDSQVSFGIVVPELAELPREEKSANFSVLAFRTGLAVYCQFVTAASQHREPGSSLQSVPESFVQYLLSLSVNETLAARRVIREILTSFPISEEANEMYFDYLASEIITSHEYRTCEVSLTYALDVLSALSPAWSDPDAVALSSKGSDLLSFFLDTVWEKGYASPVVQRRIVDVLHSLIRVRPDYSLGASFPALLTTLFSLLQDGPIQTKYYIARLLPRLFGLFILARHEPIFDDVHNSIPKDKTWKEGIAIRLLVYSELAASWPSLRRRCIYHIFEAAGVISCCVQHATACIASLSNALGFPSSTGLFKLFAPQLLYTWLAEDSLSIVPWAVFGYSDLRSLLKDVEDEVVALVMMRSQTSELDSISQEFGETPEATLRRNFARSAAYCICRDTCSPNSGQSQRPATAETTARMIVSKENYGRLMQRHFPYIFALFFVTLEEEDQVEKAFARRDYCRQALQALSHMKGISSSPSDLPIDRQPSFKSKFLLDEIERLSRRTGHEPGTMWSKQLYVYVLRILIDRIHPALGDLQSCSVIRKIRIVVSMAGNVALEGYPLEMLLRALRPFLTSHQCADDTLGIVQYLLHKGTSYIQSQLPFVASMSVSMLMSLRAFLGSSHDSTTQESQHLATLEKARAFHTWFKEYVQSFSAMTASRTGDESSDRDTKAFLELISAASDVRVEGNATEGTSESRLLHEMLKDWSSGRQLLRGQARELAFRLLCENFKPSDSSRHDILRSHSEAAALAPFIWRSCQWPHIGDGYLRWASKIFGRAWKGLSISTKVDDLPAWSLSSKSTKVLSTTSPSRLSVLDIISSLLISDNQHEVGLAEDTLRAVFSKMSTNEEGVMTLQVIPESTVSSLTLHNADPIYDQSSQESQSFFVVALRSDYASVVDWVQNLAVCMAAFATDDHIVGSLTRLLLGVSQTANKLFPRIVHIVLRREADKKRIARQQLSDACHEWFKRTGSEWNPYVNVFLDTILYLRSQIVPHERTILDRDSWLELDYMQAAKAALNCSRHTSALLFAETHATQLLQSSSRRSSSAPPALRPDFLQSIYEGIDEPDSFYGIDQDPTLKSVLVRLDHESDGLKSLAFRSSQYASNVRRSSKTASDEVQGLVRSIATLNLDGLTYSLTRNQGAGLGFKETTDNMLRAAIKLGQWDIRAPEHATTEPTTMFKVLQALSKSDSLVVSRECLQIELLKTLKRMSRGSNVHSRIVDGGWRTLTALSEIDELLDARGSSEIEETLTGVHRQGNWMDTGRLDDVQALISYRQAALALLNTKPKIRSSLHMNAKEAQEHEVRELLRSSALLRKHGARQESLTIATYLSDVVSTCTQVGLTIDAAVKREVSAVLWDQGETSASIHVLQDLINDRLLETQDIVVGKAGLLAQLGHLIAEARLEKPEDIPRKYLDRAIKELKSTTGEEAGNVFHEYAVFCDKQIQDFEALEELSRSKRTRDHRKAELDAYEKALRAARSKGESDRNKQLYRRTKSWFDIENREFQRLATAKENFVLLSLQNYLRALHACDEHDHDVLRFFSLWLEFCDTTHAIDSAKEYLASVPSHKFALLMNQLTSRLLDDHSLFQSLLNELVIRICMDHPFHGMYHIYAGTMQSPTKESASKLRHAAAKQIAQRLKADKRSNKTWTAIQESNNIYHELAMYKDDKTKAGREFSIEKADFSRKMVQKVPRLHVPPATITVELRPNADYSDVPSIVSFKSKMSIANGLSAPKIVTAVASNGRNYKQLLKGGNDDLRQDAIMEQVFEQVSKLLRNHAATRQRNLHIRTYKVLPLSSGSGIMEFVQNTLPLASYVNPAHEKYHPKDWTPNVCRQKIGSEVQNSVDARVKAYKDVAAHFRPVLRFFFLERFGDPDVWFQRRLAYTRSTAAISILGHVLGLGDRHCHNILLDEKSGEAVHIDLGVAFEAGRVLPVPEVVPFRLTRDIVDGMGYTRTEGVFRRCCEFTMEALREKKETIMILLNVLKYDPLYSWTVSPLRAKRMQEAAADDPAVAVDGDKGFQIDHSGSKARDEADEASRALGIVGRKLGGTLSTTAAVNELIQQAADERNLALLYQGWAAYS